MTAHIWREERVKWATRRRGKMVQKTITALVSDAAPGLYVREANWTRFDESAADLPHFFGGMVCIRSTGTELTHAFVGTEPACELAVTLAQLHDWTTCKPGERTVLPHKAFEAVDAALKAANLADEPRMAAEIARQQAERERDTPRTVAG